MSQVSLAPPALTSSERPARTWPWPDLVVWCCFLLMAVAITGGLWANPAGRLPTNLDSFRSDIYLNVWFMRYAGMAVSHGHLPALITTAVNSPHGINVMWNTSLLLPGVLLAPLTLLAGPTVSLLVLQTIGFAGSAGALYYVLRRWGASTAAAVVGGAVYAFSPAILAAAGDHYHLQFAVLPPLIVDAGLRLATGRGRPLWTGAWLGLLMAAQVFIAEEILVDTALAGVVAIAVLAASRPREIRLQRLGTAAAGAGVAVAVTLVICGRALWVQFIGPLTEHGTPWNVHSPGSPPSEFVTAPSTEAFHGAYGPYLSAIRVQPMESFSYLGWPLLIAVVVATIFFWRDLRIRVAGLTFAVLEWMSLGSHIAPTGHSHFPVLLLPWHYLMQVPGLKQALAQRLPIVGDGAAAAVLAFAIDRVRTALPVSQRWRGPVVAVAAAAVLLPIIPRPIATLPVTPPPPGWQATIAKLHLKAGAPVLVLPINPSFKGRADPMEWQALTGERISLVGGYCLAPGVNGAASLCSTMSTITSFQHETIVDLFRLATGFPKVARHLSFGVGPPYGLAAMAILTWRPDAVVADVGSNAGLARYLIALLGQPLVRQGAMLGWRTEPLVPALQNIAHRCVSRHGALVIPVRPSAACGPQPAASPVQRPVHRHHGRSGHRGLSVPAS